MEPKAPARTPAHTLGSTVVTNSLHLLKIEREIRLVAATKNRAAKKPLPVSIAKIEPKINNYRPNSTRSQLAP